MSCVHLNRIEKERIKWDGVGREEKIRTEKPRGRAGENKRRERMNFTRFLPFSQPVIQSLSVSFNHTHIHNYGVWLAVCVLCNQSACSWPFLVNSCVRRRALTPLCFLSSLALAHAHTHSTFRLDRFMFINGFPAAPGYLSYLKQMESLSKSFFIPAKWAAMYLFQGFLVCEWIKMCLKAFMYEHNRMHQGWLKTQGGPLGVCVCISENSGTTNDSS